MPEPCPRRPRNREERLDRLLREADSCRAFLRAQREVRVFVEHARGRGHQGSSLTLLRHLVRIVPWSASTQVTLVYREEEEARKISEFLGTSSRDGAVLDGVPVRFRSVEEVRREPWLDFGCTGASDSRHDLLHKVRCRSFLWMQPYHWGNPERICLRSNGATTRDALVTHPWTADFDCHRLAFALPPPDEPDWAGLGESRSLQVVQSALAANRRPDVALLPVYGMGRESSMGASYALLRNVLLGARDALRRGLDSAVLVLDLSADMEPQAIERLRRLLDRQEDGLSRQVCTEVDEDPRRLCEKIDALRRGGLLLVHAGGYKPQRVFEHVLSQAKLPYVFEGAGTASRAVGLGKPFLQASNCSFHARRVGRQPRCFEMAYPILRGFPRSLPYSLQKIADSILLLVPAPSLLGTHLVDCGRGDTTLLAYFASLAERFAAPRRDRLVLALGLLELLRRHKELRGQGRVPRWAWDSSRGTLEED